MLCQLLQDVEFSQHCTQWKTKVKTNNKQIVVFKNVTYNISDYFRLTSVNIFSTLYNKILWQEEKIQITHRYLWRGPSLHFATLYVSLDPVKYRGLQNVALDPVIHRELQNVVYMKKNRCSRKRGEGPVHKYLWNNLDQYFVLDIRHTINNTMVGMSMCGFSP